MAAADKTDEGTEVCSKHQYSAQRVCRKLGLLHTLRCWIGLLRIAYNPYAVGLTGLLGYGGAYGAINSADPLLMLGTDFPFSELAR